MFKLRKFCIRAITIASASFSVTVYAYVSPPSIDSDSFVLIDANTQGIIAEQNIDKPRDIASLTKLMTAYVALKEIEHGTLSLDDIATVSEKAWRTTGSRMFLEAGKKLSVDDLMQGMLIVSGNDASVVIAEHIAGSTGEFVNLMNSYAYQLGMEDTKFINPTGLPDVNRTYNISTARDMATLSAALLSDFPEVIEYTSQTSYTHDNIPQRNRNALLHTSPHYEGLKTGWSRSAEYCIALSYEKDGRRLIAIILGAKSPDQRAKDGRTLINYGYRWFSNVTPITANDRIHDIPVWFGEKSTIGAYPARDFTITVPRMISTNAPDTDLIELKAFFDGNEPHGTQLFAPIDEAMVVGSLEIHYDSRLIDTVPIVTKETVEEAGLFKRAIDWIKLNTFGSIKR